MSSCGSHRSRSCGLVLPPWRRRCCCRRWPPPREPRRNSSPSRSGRSRCRKTGFSARLPASRSTPKTISGSSTGRRRCSTTRKARRRTRRETKCCKAAPPVLKFDRRRQSARLLGRRGAGQHWVQERARHPRRPRRQCLGRRQQRRRPDPEIHAGRKIPPADRQGRRHQGLGVADPARPAGAHDDRR